MKNQYIKDEYINGEYQNLTKQIDFILTDLRTRIEKENVTLIQRELIEAFKIINGILSLSNFGKLDLNGFTLSTTYQTFLSKIDQILNKVLIVDDVDYSYLFDKSGYHLSDDELTSIQETINALREKVKNTKELNEEHKNRILKKLNELQNQFDKTMSTFDNVIGKTVTILKVMSFGRKEVVSPLMKDTTELLKVINNMETIKSELPNTENQIDFEETLKLEA